MFLKDILLGRGNIQIGDYWFSWVDGVLLVEEDNFLGFYWDLEYVWMFKDYWKGKQNLVINLEVFLRIVEKIYDYGLKFIWILLVYIYVLSNIDIWLF